MMGRQRGLCQYLCGATLFLGIHTISGCDRDVGANDHRTLSNVQDSAEVRIDVLGAPDASADDHRGPRDAHSPAEVRIDVEDDLDTRVEADRRLSRVRDSADIRIVVSEDPLWTSEEQWLIAPLPDARISEAKDTGPPFFRVTGALLTADGEIVIANASTAELLFLDLDGSWLRAVGGRGSGPGEFLELKQLIPYVGDSLAVYDWRLRRISVLDSQGRFGRTTRLPSEIGPGAELIGATTDGSFVVGAVKRSQASWGQLVHDTVGLMLVGAGGSLATELFRFTQEYLALDPMGRIQAPLTASPSVAAHEDHILFTDGKAFEVRVYRSSGELESIFRKRRSPRPVTTADQRAFLDLWREDRASAAGRIGRVQDRRLAFPATFPVYGAMLSDPKGYIWAMSYSPSPNPDAVRWTIFRSSGEWVGEVSLPPMFPMRIMENYIIGVRRDDMDVEYVEVYQVSRSAGGSGEG